MTDLDTRLRALDPVADPAALDVSEDRLRAGLAAIFAVEPPTLWSRLRSRTAATIAGLVAVFALGTGVAFAAGIPQDVRRAFADEQTAPGAPVPWNAHDIRLAATLPLNRGRHLQIWTAVNDLNHGPCIDYQVISADGRSRDGGHGCEGGYLSTSTPGVVPHDPGLLFEYHAVQLDEFLPDGVHGAVYDVAQVVQPGVTRAVLKVQGSPDRLFALDTTSGWGIVRLPGTGDGIGYTGTPLVVLYDARGHVVSTTNLDTGTVTPDVFYLLDGRIAPGQAAEQHSGTR